MRIGFSKKAWANDGLHYLGCDEVGHISEIATNIGFDYMSLLKGLGGGLAGAAGGGGGDQQSVAAMRAEMERKAAEKSASNMKMALIGVGALATAGLVALVVRR